mmetsp:Transcript_51514/g.125635  ORF Transcript_51514/g.125635 Transcript_51514/m.125635 type:complete len:635 (+) Transcript_51514:205-2109(+)
MPRARAGSKVVSSAKKDAKRKETDMLKKRKRRGMTNELIKQLEGLLPHVEWARSMHETLADAAKEMRRRARAGASPANRPSQAPVKMEIEDSTPAGGQAGGVPDDLFRAGMKMCRETGVGLLSPELIFLDASNTLASIFLAGDGAAVDGALLTGRPLSDFVTKEDDIECVQSALKYIREGKFDSEENRKGVVGIRHMVGGQERHMPLELVLVPCASAPGGHAYMVSAHPVTEEAPLQWLHSVIAKMGSVFDSDGVFLPLDVSHSLDSDGDHKINYLHKMSDPICAFIGSLQKMVQAGSVDEFNKAIGSRLSPVGVLWAQLQRTLRPSEWGSDPTKLEKRFKVLEQIFTDSMQSKLSVHNDCASIQFTLNGVSVFRVLMRETADAEGGVGTFCSYGRKTHPAGFEAFEENGANGLGCKVLSNGALWLYSRGPLRVPVDRKILKSGNLSIACNCLIQPDFGAGKLTFSKFSAINDDWCSSFRTMVRAQRENQQCGDFALFCHLIGVLEHWVRTKTLTPDFLSANRFECEKEQPADTPRDPAATETINLLQSGDSSSSLTYSTHSSGSLSDLLGDENYKGLFTLNRMSSGSFGNIGLSPRVSTGSLSDLLGYFSAPSSPRDLSLEPATKEKYVLTCV